ncbi:arsenate reductase [Erythrobacter sanguineus]|uniref:Transcriptional regulator, Spx/MgsR family n=1 Tax=Erythrobacter sanguineus TaxID=198312 RepID=A0A1M7RWB6_9SPHN|nr:arsenate reductase [Erythrobacter sanguineus]SHN50657.1 transcriptional regulator, Spx/MgsR family [Erythrobacter sanguineus]
MTSIPLYGIPNCDTVKKARVWLDNQGIEHAFHDYKKQGADPEKLAAWIAQAGLDVVVNRKGTTYRKLSDADKAATAESHTAVALLVQHPSIIKRPIVEHPGGVLVGFREDEWSAALL